MDDLNKKIDSSYRRLDHKFNEVIMLVKELFLPQKTTIQNIFRTISTYCGKQGTMVIDDNSAKNFVSTTMFNKLNLQV